VRDFLKHCLAVSLIALLAVGAPADVVQTSNPRTSGGSGGGGGGVTIGDAVTGGTATRVLFVDGSGNLGEDADFTFSTDRVTATNATLGTATVSALTAGRVTFAGTAGLLADDADLTFATDTLTVTKIGDEASVCDDGDTTKCFTFEASGVTTGNTRVITLPNANATIAATNVAAAWTASIIQTGINGGVEAVTTAKTTTANETGETYTNTGDADGATITLLNDPTAGTYWKIAVTVAQTLTIVPSAGESLYLGADQCGVSITSNAIGSTLEIRTVVGGSGGVFMAFGSIGTLNCND
jgi:hypothetical protein